MMGKSKRVLLGAAGLGLVSVLAPVAATASSPSIADSCTFGRVGGWQQVCSWTFTTAGNSYMHVNATGIASGAIVCKDGSNAERLNPGEVHFSHGVTSCEIVGGGDTVGGSVTIDNTP